MNYINSNYTKDELNILTDDEFKTLYDKTYKYLFSEKRMGAKSKAQLKKWKISNIFNNYGNYQIEELEQMSDDEINRIYSEYHSLRITELSPTYGGYKKTKKGWYEFSDGAMFFYRSSWEFDTCKNLDNLLFNCVKKIETPEPIVYEYDGIKHHYFADIKVTYNNGKIMSPIRKLEALHIALYLKLLDFSRVYRMQRINSLISTKVSSTATVI